MALTTKFVNSLTDKYGVSLIWLDQSVETLCTYIKSILDGFRRDPLDDRKLKISLFFAKVLQKLFGDLTKQLYRTSCHRSFIAMLRTYQEIKYVLFSAQVLGLFEGKSTGPYLIQLASIPVFWTAHCFFYSKSNVQPSLVLIRRILHSEDTKISSLNEPLVACLRSIVGHTVTAELLLSESSDGNSCICIEIMKILAKSTAHDHLYLDKEHSRNLLHHLIFTFGIKGWLRCRTDFSYSLSYSKIPFIANSKYFYEYHWRDLRGNSAPFGCIDGQQSRHWYHRDRGWANTRRRYRPREHLRWIFGAWHLGTLQQVCLFILIDWIHPMNVVDFQSFNRHIPSGRQLQYYKYWCKVNFQRSPLNYSVSNGLIKSLLRILFASMPASLQTHIVSQLRSTDFATILAIGWSRMAMCDSNTSRNLLHAMNNDIPKYLSQLTAHKDAKSYYQLVRPFFSRHFRIPTTDSPNPLQIQCLTCVSKGIEFTTLAFDGILMSKLEDLLTTGATEQHAELFTAIATYLTAGNKQYVIADAGKSTHIVATIVRLKCLDIALRQSNNYTESKHFIQAILDGILKGYRDGIDPLEKMLIVRTLCQLNSANVRSDQRDDIESIKHQLYQWMEQSDESCESKYQEIMRDHVLLDVCAAAVPHNPSSQLSRREFTLILDEMEAQARKLENIYNSGARVHQDINHRSYYEQIDRIVNCLNSFKNEN